MPNSLFRIVEVTERVPTDDDPLVKGLYDVTIDALGQTLNILVSDAALLEIRRDLKESCDIIEVASRVYDAT